MFKKYVGGGKYWIGLAEDRDSRLLLVNVLMSLRN
jgi:hypothetical protein